MYLLKTSRQKSIIAITIAISLAMTTSCSLIQPVNASPTYYIIIQDFTFDPQILKIRRGYTVTWLNNDPVIHTLWFVNADDQTTCKRIGCEGLSEPILPGGSWSWVFDETVELQYYSFEHLWMTGYITVRRRAGGGAGRDALMR
jgi:plastocyanin